MDTRKCNLGAIRKGLKKKEEQGRLRREHSITHELSRVTLGNLEQRSRESPQSAIADWARIQGPRPNFRHSVQPLTEHNAPEMFHAATASITHCNAINSPIRSGREGLERGMLLTMAEVLFGFWLDR